MTLKYMDIKNLNYSNNEKGISGISPLGKRLRQARKSMGLSQRNIAESLCLKLSVIKKIEEGSYKYSSKISSIFFNGYIRSYARLVNVDNIEDDTEISQLPAVFSSVIIKKKSNIVSLYQGCSSKIKFLIVFCLVFCISVIIACITVWCSACFFLKNEYLGIMNLKSIRSMIYLQERANVKWRFKEFLLSNNDYCMYCNNLFSYCYYIEPSLLCSFFQDLESIKIFLHSVKIDNLIFNVLDYNISNIVNSANDNTLVLSFTSDCWVEVVDSANTVLYIGTKHSGDILNLAGNVPYRVVIGVPESVCIRYQGGIIDIDEFVNKNKIARLTIPPTYLSR